MTYHHLIVNRTGPVLHVALNRPEVRNALSADLIAELTRCFTTAGTADDLRVVILSGNGKVFCAGADIGSMQAAGQLAWDENRADALALAGMLHAVNTCPVPVIARIHGAAFGGGAGLAAAADIVITEATAKFAFSEVRLGLTPAIISTFVLRKIGMGRARRYLLTGEQFSGTAAVTLGLAHEAVATLPELDDTVTHIVNQVLRNGPHAVRTTKALLRELEHPVSPSVLERCAETTARIRAGHEAQEGLAAFRDHRPPAYVDTYSPPKEPS